MIIPLTESTNCYPSKQINRGKHLYNLQVVHRRDTNKLLFKLPFDRSSTVQVCTVSSPFNRQCLSCVLSRYIFPPPGLHCIWQFNDIAALKKHIMVLKSLLAWDSNIFTESQMMPVESQMKSRSPMARLRPNKPGKLGT